MEKFVLGLTGGIASGKSVVSALFQESGAKVVDADVVSREIMKDGSETVLAIGKAFAGTVTNGVLDRAELKKQAFSSPENTEKLNKITHEAILSECKRQIEQLSGFVLLVVPLMFETCADKLCDQVLTVSCPEKMRIERIVMRDNISEDLAKSIIARQMSDSEREKRATYVIRNDSSLEELIKKAKEYIKKFGLN